MPIARFHVWTGMHGKSPIPNRKFDDDAQIEVIVDHVDSGSGGNHAHSQSIMIAQCPRIAVKRGGSYDDRPGEGWGRSSRGGRIR